MTLLYDYDDFKISDLLLQALASRPLYHSRMFVFQVVEKAKAAKCCSKTLLVRLGGKIECGNIKITGTR